MSQNSPWSVKSVTQDARDAAKQAARRAGLTIGGWLSQTIITASENELRENTLPDATNGDGGAVAPEDGSISLPLTPLPAEISSEIQENSGTAIPILRNASTTLWNHSYSGCGVSVRR